MSLIERLRNATSKGRESFRERIENQNTANKEIIDYYVSKITVELIDSSLKTGKNFGSLNFNNIRDDEVTKILTNYKAELQPVAIVEGVVSRLSFEGLKITSSGTYKYNVEWNME